MKHLILTCLLTITIWFCNAQTMPEINYSDSSTLLVNKIKLFKDMDIHVILKNLGEPTRILPGRNTEKTYYYDNDGFILMAQDSLLKGIGINYNWDGDKKFPEKSFTGSLKIGGQNISKETKKENIDAIKTIGFICPIDILCVSKSKTAKVKCTVAFGSDLVTQLIFILN